jgi:hypothetical protein
MRLLPELVYVKVEEKLELLKYMTRSLYNGNKLMAKTHAMEI